MAEPLIFDTPLTEGVIIKRKNRFIMEVKIGDELFDCHCPTTGRVGDIVFSNNPCLLSKSANLSRKTQYTVEAFSVDLPSTKNKSWIGINQNAINRYVEYFLKTEQFKEIVGSDSDIKREQKLGNSKLDFCVGNTYIEVKTPLYSLQVNLPKHILTSKATSEFNSFERFVKHIEELANSLKSGNRAILLNCFIYNNPGYLVPKKSKNSEYISSVVQNSIEKGVEIWQADFKITPIGVSLTKYFETTETFLKGGSAFVEDI